MNKLRENGVNKIKKLRQDIVALRKSKMVHPQEKRKQIKAWKEEIRLAKKDAAQNKAAIDELVKESVAYANKAAKTFIEQVTIREDETIAKAKQAYLEEVRTIKEEAKRAETAIRSEYKGRSRKELKAELEAHRYKTKTALFDARSHRQQAIDQALAAKNQAFVDHVQTNRNLRNGKTKFSEDRQLKRREYRYNFKLSQFLLANGLYIAIGIFFIVVIILAPLSGAGNLLTLPNILTILEQASTRMFFALGVAGLILLAGTDLS
ncbi:MAG: galactoside ABC transporter permease, partial [Peptococcales bacterium]